jgi:hypothetical protein
LKEKTSKWKLTSMTNGDIVIDVADEKEIKKTFFKAVDFDE